jgi:hypothetical protein
MRIYIFYRPNSEHERITKEYAERLEKEQDVKVRLVDVNTRDGYADANIYDVMQYPTVMVTRDDGQMSKMWSGTDFPQVSEINHITRGI